MAKDNLKNIPKLTTMTNKMLSKVYPISEPLIFPSNNVPKEREVKKVKAIYNKKEGFKYEEGNEKGLHSLRPALLIYGHTLSHV